MRATLSLRSFGLIALVLVLSNPTSNAAELTGPSADTKTNRVDVVCLGDSITHRGYPESLEKILHVRVVNAGINGNTSRQGLARLKRDVLSHQPKVVVVFFGANDSRLDAPKTQVGVEEYAANLSKIIDQCESAHAEVLLGTMPPITPETYFTRHPKKNYDAVGGFEKHVKKYYDASVKVAHDKHVQLVDLNRELRKHPNWVSDDGVHPTAEGNEIIAEIIAEKVKPMLDPAGK